MNAGHRQVDHTADLALEVWADTEAELLLESARAVVEVMTEGARIAATGRRHVSIDAVDREDRLVQWLNDVIYAATTEGFVFADGDMALTDCRLDADVRGERDACDRVRTELKSATYHDLRVRPTDAGWSAHVVIDV